MLMDPGGMHAVLPGKGKQMQEIALGKHFGSMLLAEADQELQHVAPELVMQTVKRSGVLLLRGFRGDVAAFEHFTQGLAGRFVHNGNETREAVGDGGKTRTVTPGRAFVGPHSEFCSMPFRPDLIFFYCVRPAASGGASLAWDGKKLWEDMPRHLREIFLGKRIQYHSRGVAAEFFAQLLGEGGIDAVCDFLDTIPDLRYTVRDGKFDLEYTCAAQIYSESAEAMAFSNSVAIDPKTLFDDGSELPPLERAELLDLALRHTLTLDMQAGDLIVIDNWRVMHGRGAFEDPERRICVRMGFIDAMFDKRFAADLEEIEY
jgi:hypothetical protein